MIHITYIQKECIRALTVLMILKLDEKLYISVENTQLFDLVFV